MPRNRIYEYLHSKIGIDRRGYSLSLAIFAFLLVLVTALHFQLSPAKTTFFADAPPAAPAPMPSPTPIPTALNANFSDQVTKCFIPTAAVYGYDLYISAGFRSYKDQNALYAQGRTVNGHIVTNAQGGMSIHNFGLAVDVADHRYGQSIDWGKLETIGNYCGLEHGDRGFVDLPHFEYRGGIELADLQVGKAPVPLVVPCATMAMASSLTKADLDACGAPNMADTTANIYVPMKPLNPYYPVNNDE